MHEATSLQFKCQISLVLFDRDTEASSDHAEEETNIRKHLFEPNLKNKLLIPNTIRRRKLCLKWNVQGTRRKGDHAISGGDREEEIKRSNLTLGLQPRILFIRGESYIVYASPSGS